MQVSHSMILNVIARGGDAFGTMRDLIFGSHEPWRRQLQLARRALAIYRTLRTAEVVQQAPDGTITLTVDLQPNFALNQPLSPFALAVFDLLEPDSPTYALDMISVIEATLDDPRPVLMQQQHEARGEAIGAMKAEGIEYDERMELLEQITWPKPLEQLLGEAFEVYAASQPWIGDFELSPKSVVRDLAERAMTFTEYVSHYGLQRSEGLVLRYLSDAYRAARQTIPDEAKTEELLDLIEWLGELVRQVDSSLLDEWEALAAGRKPEDEPVRPPSVLLNPRAFRVLVRNELFRRVQLFARRDGAALAQLDPSIDWTGAIDGYFAEHDALGTGPDARGPQYFVVDEHPDRWTVRQLLDDPAGNRDWQFVAEVGLAESADAGTAVVRMLSAGRVDG
jgi:hypothetical protein